MMEYHNIEYDTSYGDGQYRKTVSNDKLREKMPMLIFKDIDFGLTETIQWFCENYENVRK